MGAVLRGECISQCSVFSWPRLFFFLHGFVRMRVFEVDVLSSLACPMLLAVETVSVCLNSFVACTVIAHMRCFIDSS
jgi:hypothetical protein